ncbi:MAG: hypothetical protein H0V76_03650, partial [Blastocatellia bacterium]|nr:hypothetical protein [Blastocatellia bacterium]
TYSEDAIFAGTDNGLFRTTDVTKGWQKVNLGEEINSNIFVVYSTPVQPGTIWLGTMTSGVLVSRDNGRTWDKMDVAPRGIPITAITIDTKRPNNIYVGTTQSLYLSRDGGRRWTRRGGGLPLGKYTSILVNPDNTDEIFAASSLESDGGVFFSSDAGERWTRIDQGMPVPSRRVWAMAFDPRDPNRIFAASHSSGIYRIDRIPERAAEESKTDAVSRTVIQ